MVCIDIRTYIYTYIYDMMLFCIIHSSDLDTESREALVMEDINVASHDQEHSVQNSHSMLEETACTELPDSINIISTVKEADENSELQVVSHCHNPVTDGEDNLQLSVNYKLSHRNLVGNKNEGTEDHEDVIAMDELSTDNNILSQ